MNKTTLAACALLAPAVVLGGETGTYRLKPADMKGISQWTSSALSSSARMSCGTPVSCGNPPDRTAVPTRLRISV